MLKEVKYHQFVISSIRESHKIAMSKRVISGIVLSRTKLGRISEKYSYIYNVLKCPVTFDFGVNIDCSSDEEITLISTH